jgi:H+/Cl- antiporter ClcA
MFITLISIVILFGLFIALAVLALRHGADTRTDTRGSLVAGDRSAPAGWFWR